MRSSEIREEAVRQLDAAFASVRDSQEIEGVAFTVSYKKTPAMEIRTVFQFAKGTKITED